MRAFDKLRLRFRSLFGRARVDSELDAEMRFHLDQLIEENIAKGMTPREARDQALRSIGGIAQYTEECRDMRRTAFIENFVQDVRYSLRTLKKTPAFTAVVIATLALGIGGVAAMFSAFDAILIRPMPYADADRLVMIWDYTGEKDVVSRHNPTPAEWYEWRRLNTVFTDLACSEGVEITLGGDGTPEQLPGRRMTWNLWSVLGTQPLLGRAYTQEEDEKGVKVAVISHGLWQRHFGGVRDIIGRKIPLNDEPYEVIGVMPPSFYFMPSREIDVWIPASFEPFKRRSLGWHSAQVVARMKPGVTLEHVRQSMHALNMQVTAKAYRGARSVIIVPLREEVAGRTQTALILLLSASVALLLIACVNLANLLLSRGTVRGREVAVRAALGADRGRLIAQFLTESLVLAVFGTLAGLALAVPAMRFLERLVPEAMGAANLTLDWRVLGFSATVAIAAALAFGLAPALRGSRLAPQEGLRDGGRGTAGARSHWFQHSLIVVETALAVALLTCGGLLLQTFQHLRGTDIGFRSESLLTFETPLFRYKEPDRRIAFVNAEVEAVRSIPGVINAGAISNIPFTNVANATFYWLEGQPDEETKNQVALTRNVSRDYFTTVGATLLDGRFFTTADQGSKEILVIINDTMAQRHFRGRSPVGTRFKFGNTGEKGAWHNIVGVVKTIRESGVLAETKPAVYRLNDTCEQISHETGIVIRTAVDPASIIPAVRQAIWSLDKAQPIARVRTVQDIIDKQLSTPTQSTTLLGAFAVLALILASTGLYGVLSYAVTQRTNEIGVRMALGATSRDILLTFSKRGLVLTLVGLAIGLVLAAMAARLLTALLYGFQPGYALSAAVVSVLLLAVAALASFVPARRASRIDPVNALQRE